MENQFQECIRQYQQNLSSGDIEFLEPLDNYEEIQKSIQDCVTSKRNKVFMLYGNKGMGKKSAIRWAVSKNPNQILIELDALIHYEENTFVSQLLTEIERFSQQKMYSNITENNLRFEKLNGYIQDINYPMIIMIDEINELAKEKKQSILYSILDWIQNHKNNIILVGISRNQKFIDNLEKRVRSRMAPSSYYFVDYNQDLIYKIIQKRLNGPYKQMNDKIMQMIKDQQSPYFDRFQILFNSYEWILNFIKISLCVYKQQDESLSNAFEQTYKMLNLQTNKQLIMELTKPELLILLTIRCMINKEKLFISFEKITQEIQDFLKQLRSQQIISKHPNYSNIILKKAFESLLKMQIIEFQENSENEVLTLRKIILLITKENIETMFEAKREFLPESFRVLYKY